MTVISDNDGDLRSGKVDWVASCVAVLSTWQYACKEVVEKKGCTQAFTSQGGSQSSASLWERLDDGFGH